MAFNATLFFNSTGMSEGSVSGQVFARFIELISAPYHYPALLWITIPLIAALFAMDIYFGRYRKEELGWNTAVGNALALLFVAMDLFRTLYNRLIDPSLFNLVFGSFKEVLIVFFLALGSLWLFVAHFFHVLPKRLAYLISSSLPTTLFAYLAIILIYSGMPLDKFTLVAAVVLAVVLGILLKIIHFLVPMYRTREEALKLLKK